MIHLNLNYTYGKEFNFTILIRDALSCQNNPELLSLKSSFVGSQFLFLISDCIKLDKEAKIMIEMEDAKQIIQKGLLQLQRSLGEHFDYINKSRFSDINPGLLLGSFGQ